MRRFAVFALAWAGVQASPIVPSPAAPAGPGTTTWSGNPFASVTLWANAYYASEVSASAIPTLSADMASKAAEVAKVPSFMWLSVLTLK